MLIQLVERTSKLLQNVAFRLDITCYGHGMSAFGVRILTEVSKEKPIIVTAIPVLRGSDSNAMHQWMNRSSSPIQSINWNDHNDTSRYVMRSLYMYFMLILVPRQCSWCGNLLAHWKRKKCLLHVQSIGDLTEVSTEIERTDQGPAVMEVGDAR